MTEDDNAMSAPQWFSELCSQAEILRHELEDATPEDACKTIKSVVERNEIVVGIWPDAAGPGGFNSAVIKGAEILLAIACGKSEQRTLAAIPCACYEQAIAASQEWGDMQCAGSRRLH